MSVVVRKDDYAKLLLYTKWFKSWEVSLQLKIAMWKKKLSLM